MVTVARIVRLLALTLALPCSLAAQRVGPQHGALLLAGGGVRDPAIFETFISLSGGPEATIVVIPTAGGAAAYTQTFSVAETLRRLGAAHVTVLHTYDRSIADSDEFFAPLSDAGGVWFSGGRQWRLADAYLGTETEAALWRLLERGGAIGGSSAGATIQGSYLVRGDTRTNTIMMGDHKRGFGFLRQTAVDQHLLRRNRHFDLVPVIEAHPELLGIGLDENTAIVVRADTFEVIGHGYVAIYDAGAMIGPDGRFYFLAPGDRFDLATREAVRPTPHPEPVPRVVRRAWPRP